MNKRPKNEEQWNRCQKNLISAHAAQQQHLSLDDKIKDTTETIIQLRRHIIAMEWHLKELKQIKLL